MNKEQLIKLYEKYAKSQGFKLQTDKKILDQLINAQLENEKKHGHRFCPCKARIGEFETDKKIIINMVYFL